MMKLFNIEKNKSDLGFLERYRSRQVMVMFFFTTPSNRHLGRLCGSADSAEFLWDPMFGGFTQSPNDIVSPRPFFLGRGIVQENSP